MDWILYVLMVVVVNGAPALEVRAVGFSDPASCRAAASEAVRAGVLASCERVRNA